VKNEYTIEGKLKKSIVTLSKLNDGVFF